MKKKNNKSKEAIRLQKLAQEQRTLQKIKELRSKSPTTGNILPSKRYSNSPARSKTKKQNILDLPTKQRKSLVQQAIQKSRNKDTSPVNRVGGSIALAVTLDQSGSSQGIVPRGASGGSLASRAMSLSRKKKKIEVVRSTSASSYEPPLQSTEEFIPRSPPIKERMEKAEEEIVDLISEGEEEKIPEIEKLADIFEKNETVDIDTESEDTKEQDVTEQAKRSVTYMSYCLKVAKFIMFLWILGLCALMLKQQIMDFVEKPDLSFSLPSPERFSIVKENGNALLQAVRERGIVRFVSGYADQTRLQANDFIKTFDPDEWRYTFGYFLVTGFAGFVLGPVIF
eukprot:snap_masked-scaffold_40-processed-gene-2.33-mRNA-1 protein AED:1.00 eAED:1.00 QI:0/-1/0/0/-1/1/1/0/339